MVSYLPNVGNPYAVSNKKGREMKELATALCKAQSQIRGAIKDSTNPHFRSDYADLESVWDACREALHGNGLSVVQVGADAPEGHIAIKTMLLHESGQYIDGVMTLPMVKRDPQAAGSAITYARRYSLAAMVGVVQVDDDGNAATQQPKKQQTPAQPQETLKAKLYRLSGEDAERIKVSAKELLGITDTKKLTDGDMVVLIEHFEALK